MIMIPVIEDIMLETGEESHDCGRGNYQVLRNNVNKRKQTTIINATILNKQ